MDNIEDKLARIETALDAMRRALVSARDQLWDGLKLTRTQLEILILLSEGAQTTHELAAKLYLTQSAVTQTIGTLVRRDYVLRQPNDKDRRVIRLVLSSSGREIASQINDIRGRTMKALAADLSSPEVDLFVKLTDKITTIIKAAPTA